MLNSFYFRQPSTKRSGSNFTESEKYQVWLKASTLINVDASIWRVDACGALIKFSDYGNTNSKYGWEIDHKNPVSNGGSDDLWNLQPLQWRNNRHKGDSVGGWSCKVNSNNQ